MCVGLGINLFTLISAGDAMCGGLSLSDCDRRVASKQVVDAT